MPGLLIELGGPHFKRAYLLYVIELAHGLDRFYYIGQTGDKNYHTARPALRRLSAHLEESGSSTQNQVYRYVAVEVLGHKQARDSVAFSEDVKRDVESYFIDSTVRMHSYPAKTFDPSVSHTEHLEEVAKVLQLERQVIAAFVKAGRILMNRVRTPPKYPCPHPEVLKLIESDFRLAEEGNRGTTYS